MNGSPPAPMKTGPETFTVTDRPRFQIDRFDDQPAADELPAVGEDDGEVFAYEDRFSCTHEIVAELPPVNTAGDGALAL